MNPAARKQLVMQLVASGAIESQEDLVKLLKKNGIVITQTTASRDLLEIGALRGPDSTGRTRYLLQSSQSPNPGNTRNLLLSATSSGNLVVAKTPPGGAQLLAGRIDGAISHGDLPKAIGTIAGDDTVIVVSASANGGASAFLDGKPLKLQSEKRAGGSAKSRTKQKRSQ